MVAAAAASDPDGEPSTAIPLIRSLLDAGERRRRWPGRRRSPRPIPARPQAQLVLGDTLMLLGRTGDAAAAYRRAADAVVRRADDAAADRGAASAAATRAGAADALALFLSQNPQNVAALRLSAHWQIAAGEYDAAIDTLEGLRARLGNRDAALLAELAYAYAGAGSDETARQLCRRRLSRSRRRTPRPPTPMAGRCTAPATCDGALQLLQKAVALAPAHAGLRWHIAQLYARLGRTTRRSFHAAAALTRSALRRPRCGAGADRRSRLIARLAR